MSNDQYRLLVFILKRHARGQRITHREINNHIPWAFLKITTILRSLRNLGLINYEDKKAATIVPTVHFIPARKIP